MSSHDDFGRALQDDEPVPNRPTNTRPNFRNFRSSPRLPRPTCWAARGRDCCWTVGTYLLILLMYCTPVHSD